VVSAVHDYGALPLTESIHGSVGKAAAALAFGLLISLWKLVVLAVLFYAWLPRGARCAAVTAALFWASMHLGGILTGATVVPTLLLSLSYLFFGVRLRGSPAPHRTALAAARHLRAVADHYRSSTAHSI
jgi:hypothetical protein